MGWSLIKLHYSIAQLSSRLAFFETGLRIQVATLNPFLDAFGNLMGSSVVAISG
jgi:hypothetical protein